MHFAFHVGTRGVGHMIVRAWLGRNKTLLRAEGVEMPPPDIETSVFTDALTLMRGAAATAELESALIDALVEHPDTRRVVLSRDTFLGRPRAAFQPRGLLAEAPARLRALRNLLPSCEVTVFLSLRHPAIYFAETRDHIGPNAFPDTLHLDEESLRWAPAIRAMRTELHDARLVVWCHEDAPLVFPEVMRRMVGLEELGPRRGDGLAAALVLTEAGRALLEPELMRATTPAERRSVIEACLARHANAGVVQREITLPHVDQDWIDRVGADYDADIARIAAMPGVEFMAP